jgi:hypothetical protein
VAGTQEGLHTLRRVLQDGRHRRRRQHVRAERAEVRETALACAVDGHGVGGRRSLEADREEDHAFVGMASGDGERVERRIQHAHVGALGLGLQQVARAARHAQHVAERAEDDVRARGDG